MNAHEWWGLAGVFLGGATPWLEAILVIPAGIATGLPLIPVIIAGTLGNLLTVGAAAYGGERLRQRWTTWRQRKRDASGTEPDSRSRAHREAKARRKQERIERVMDRGGLPLLAILGPLGIGTQLAALAAVAAGVRATPAFVWVGAATVGWSIAAAIAAVTGLQLLGF
ncbi:small multi-drug export protein [Nesterenkonia lutea]|uniref:Membrane protein YdbT with pleckstrin-like domain n=1 Tax=Nesterenkonia lutea TaxID=272919 RepID=A0ABR9JFJ2_9MICC|nr:small multi-drug export protein [Nesterenkonia lutea]MBE1524699.1 putative membrane protein YdbT with pleckstrin-like domain [Nesterenkonia lutea]